MNLGPPGDPRATGSDVLLPGTGAFPLSSCCFCTSCLSFVLRLLLFFPFPSCPWGESVISDGCAYAGAGVWTSCDGDHLSLVEVDFSSDFAFSGVEVWEGIWSPFPSAKDLTRCWRKVFSISCIKHSQVSVQSFRCCTHRLSRSWTGSKRFWWSSISNCLCNILVVCSVSMFLLSLLYFFLRIFLILVGGTVVVWSWVIEHSSPNEKTFEFVFVFRKIQCLLNRDSIFSYTWGYHFSFLEWVGTSCVPNLAI